MLLEQVPNATAPPPFCSIHPLDYRVIMLSVRSVQLKSAQRPSIHRPTGYRAGEPTSCRSLRPRSCPGYGADLPYTSVSFKCYSFLYSTTQIPKTLLTTRRKMYWSIQKGTDKGWAHNYDVHTDIFGIFVSNERASSLSSSRGGLCHNSGCQKKGAALRDSSKWGWPSGILYVLYWCVWLAQVFGRRCLSCALFPQSETDAQQLSPQAFHWCK